MKTQASCRPRQRVRRARQRVTPVFFELLYVLCYAFMPLHLCVALSLSFPVVLRLDVRLPEQCTLYLLRILRIPYASCVAISYSWLISSIWRDYRRTPYRGRHTGAAGEECGIQHHIPRHRVLSTPAEHSTLSTEHCINTTPW